MLRNISSWAIRLFSCVALLTCFSIAKAGPIEGIYLTQPTLEDTAYLSYLIQQAKAVGITTFVVDLEKPSTRYKTNITLLKANHINYIARIVVFPDGGLPDQIASPAYWAKRYELIKNAVAYGAQQIQLDYIRYNTKQPASAENAKNIVKVIQWYKSRLAASNIPLQADVFGIASFGESRNIGQNLQLMAGTTDALCPMVYPSHFEPFREHAEHPYQTIYQALTAVQDQFNDNMPVKMYAYIELSNYRYPLSHEKRLAYIASEIKAVQDAGADGWFAWSAHNQYDSLFRLLADYQNKVPGNMLQAVEDGKQIPYFTDDDRNPEAVETTLVTESTPPTKTATVKPVTSTVTKTVADNTTESNKTAIEPAAYIMGNHFIY